LKKIVAEKKDKPVLDEQTFGKLLEAAYVLQEHSRQLQKLELNLKRQQDELGAREQSVSLSSGSELHAPPAETSPAGAVAPGPSPAELSPANLSPVELVPEDATPARVESAAADPASRDDYTLILGHIVETQHQIQARHLELENAMSLVAERVTEIAKAGGAAIAFLDGKTVRYRGAAGRMTLPVGTEVPLEKALCVACLKTGHVIRCPDVNPEFLLDPEECRRRGIRAMIAVPVFHEAGIAGSLELYYAGAQAFSEQDVHTCQLMAGLITEALAREE